MPAGVLRFLTGAVPYVPLPFVADVVAVPLPSLLPLVTVDSLVIQAKNFASFDLIDDTKNVSGSMVFVYSGKTDKIVNNG
jgi:hypothetical protein